MADIDRSDDIFKSTLDHLLEGCQIISFDWRYLYVNDAVVRHGRKAKSELLGHRMLDVYPGIDNTPLFETLARCMTTRAAEKMVNEFVYPDGSTAWFELSIQPVPEGLFIMSLDITEYKQAINALHESEQHYRLLFENNPQPMWVYDLETLAFLAVNEAAIQHYGYSRDEFLAMTIKDICPPEDILALLGDIAHTVVTMNQAGVWRHRKKDGSLIDVEITSHTLTFAGQAACVVLANDVTEHRRAEAVQQRMAFLIEVSSTLFSSRDYDDTLAHVARLAVPGIADWCAVDILEENGMLRRVAVVHTDPSKVEWAYELQRRYPPNPNSPRGIYNVLRTRQSEIYPVISEEMWASVADEEQRRIARELGLASVIVAPLVARERALGAITLVMAESDRHYDPDDLALVEELARRAAITIDNAWLYREAQTLNAELEQRVAERTAQLEVANKELEAFSYSVSHDLRAPLRAIDGFSRILLRKSAAELSPEAQRYLNLIRDNTRQMGQLVDDLLTFARLNRQPLKRETVTMSDLVQQSLDELKAEWEERQVDLRLGDLGTGEGDPALLKQVWINLLSNALKFTRRSVPALIEVGRLDANSEHVYFVKDNGVGFDMQYYDKLFGVFQRLHRAEDYEGTGVGLAIVQRVITRHGGRVWAEAQVDKGATFYFTVGS